MDKTYLFYDIETTGRSKCFDQVLQFAAIRTDLALNELERHQMRVKLNPDTIPHPEALLVHRIPIKDMLQGQAEIQAIAQIHALLNTPGTISGGYNTLGFDDEFLRFSFHRNLLPPYTHQWANGCGRFDIYPLTQLYYLYHRSCLQWPTNANGKLSLKLEHLSNLNQLAMGAAHQAITDVEATVNLARAFYQNKAMWLYAMDFFDKGTELKRRAKITACLEIARRKYQLALLVGESNGSDFFQYPVLGLGEHWHYKNQTLWLRLDKPELVTTQLDALPDTTWVARQKAGETILLPFTGRFKQYLSPERHTVTETNLQWLSNNPSLLQAIETYYCNYKYPEVNHLDVEADLYVKGFLSREELGLCNQLHAAPAEKKGSIAQQFTNPRLQQLAARIMGRHYSHHLTPAQEEIFAHYIQSINANDDSTPIDWRGARRYTPQTAWGDLCTIKANTKMDTSTAQLLDELEKYLLENFSLHLS